VSTCSMCPTCALQAAAELDASTKLPAEAAAQQPARVVVGSLDINQGAVLPAEDLVGRLPTVSQTPGCSVNPSLSDCVMLTAITRNNGEAASNLVTCA
jgi:hypothetical protein